MVSRSVTALDVDELRERYPRVVERFTESKAARPLRIPKPKEEE
jgi:hypothetical protein